MRRSQNWHLACLQLLIFFVTVPFLSAKEPLTIRLWPHGAPGEKATPEPEKDTTTSKDGNVAGKPVIRLGNVTEPSLTVYWPSSENSKGSAVLVFPGGGYRILALDLEGTEICQWLTSLGITAALVKYRVPEPTGVPRYQQPLEDAQRAISLVRMNAAKWGIKADQIGVLGFSAGGHLAAVLGSHSAERSYTRVDEADRGSVVPNFAVLIYPAYLSVRDKGEELAPEATPTPQTPPTFIAQTEDDRTFIEGTMLYYRSLERTGVPAEMHIFSSGGHGYGLRPSREPVTGWPVLVEAWMRLRRLL